MLTTINSENLKPIRRAFDIHCGIISRTKGDLIYGITGEIEIQDSDIQSKLDSEEEVVKLADLSNGGFPLDGTREFYDSESTEKIGVHSVVDEELVVSVYSDRNIEAVTIRTSGNGILRATIDGIQFDEYELRPLLVIPCHYISPSEAVVRFRIDPASGQRVNIESITPGITLEFDNSNLISVDLDLAANLSLEPSYEVSSIEIQAYWPDDISNVISNVGDDVPIWYYSGYPGDYSETRYFYLSEKASMKDNLITIKGEDSSSKLEGYDLPAQVLAHKQNGGFKAIYNLMKNTITSSGIKLKNVQSAPGTSGTVTTTRYMALEKISSRNLICDIMNYCHHSNYWPTFVDAGIPTLYWEKPITKAKYQALEFEIKEEDCADCIREADRNINNIKGVNDDYSLSTTASQGAKTEISSQDLKKNQKASITFGDFYRSVSITNCQTGAVITADSAIWRAKAKGKSVVKGYPIVIHNQFNSVKESTGRPGITLNIDTPYYGRLYNGTTYFFPYYASLFNRSNITGSFTWKGDPRMQPRDIFKFIRLDGTEETCTVERINLKHDEGGTSAEIKYRLGVV